ncbi:MAG: hypothetical protein CM1200mP18_19480 [Gammaproteobacteria bacterium]|nr:MAG: hypothetical protein CM1200mP18_19480 [Gammaproteobacteria bacterium]
MTGMMKSLVTRGIKKGRQLALWNYIFNCDWDIMASTTKAREQGFESFEDGERMFSQILPEMAETRMFPPL